MIGVAFWVVEEVLADWVEVVVESPIGSCVIQFPAGGAMEDVHDWTLIIW